MNLREPTEPQSRAKLSPLVSIKAATRTVTARLAFSVNSQHIVFIPFYLNVDYVLMVLLQESLQAAKRGFAAPVSVAQGVW